MFVPGLAKLIAALKGIILKELFVLGLDILGGLSHIIGLQNSIRMPAKCLWRCTKLVLCQYQENTPDGRKETWN